MRGFERGQELLHFGARWRIEEGRGDGHHAFERRRDRSTIIRRAGVNELQYRTARVGGKGHGAQPMASATGALRSCGGRKRRRPVAGVCESCADEERHGHFPLTSQGKSTGESCQGSEAERYGSEGVWRL